jgi:hypothetical protein
MNIPAIKGIIDRRILINFAVEKEIIQNILPPPFSPKIYRDKAIAGICLIRLKEIRPSGFPAMVGISSENGAHRIGVEWKENGVVKEGVFIPRRDTSSIFNNLVGGRIFPGRHHLARFSVQENNGRYLISFRSDDNTTLSIDACETDEFNPHSIFENLERASDFLKTGSVGYSPNKNQFDGLKLETFDWKVSPLQVQDVQSSFFEDESRFPKGSVKFDNALLMTNIKHEWHSVRPALDLF